MQKKRYGFKERVCSMILTFALLISLMPDISLSVSAADSVHKSELLGNDTEQMAGFGTEAVSKDAAEAFYQMDTKQVASPETETVSEYPTEEFEDTDEIMPFSEAHEHQYNKEGFCISTGEGEAVCDAYEPCKGSGTLEDPYQIANAGNLYWFAAVVNGGYGDTEQNTSACARLTRDINVNQEVLTEAGKLNGNGSNFRIWTPIGNDANLYGGTFDGNSKTISGLYFNDDTMNYVGLFGYADTDSTIRNIGIKDSYFCGDYYVGGVAGENYGSIETSYHTGEVSGSYYVGGVAGENYGSIETSWHTGR